MEVADILFLSVMKPCVKLLRGEGREVRGEGGEEERGGRGRVLTGHHQGGPAPLFCRVAVRGQCRPQS